MAAVWRSTWGVIRFFCKLGHLCRAVATCLARMYSTPSEIRTRPLPLGKTRSPGRPLLAIRNYRA